MITLIKNKTRTHKTRYSAYEFQWFVKYVAFCVGYDTYVAQIFFISNGLDHFMTFLGLGK